MSELFITATIGFLVNRLLSRKEETEEDEDLEDQPEIAKKPQKEDEDPYLFDEVEEVTNDTEGDEQTEGETEPRDEDNTGEEPIGEDDTDTEQSDQSDKEIPTNGGSTNGGSDDTRMSDDSEESVTKENTGVDI